MKNNLSAWRNGNFCTVDDLTVSINDLGFTHSDAIYETWPIKDYKIFRFDHHWRRLQKGCRQSRLPLRYSAQQIQEVFDTLYRAGQISDVLAWLFITRGIPPGPRIADFQHCATQTFIQLLPMPPPVESWSLCLSKAIRTPNWVIDQTGYKSCSKQDITKARWEAVTRKYDHAALLDHNGLLTEGTGCNIGIIINNTVLAPRQNRLSGITMETVQLLCERNNIAFEYADIDTELLNNAQDMFITDSGRGVVPVCKYENRTFEAPSEILMQIREFYEQSWHSNEFVTYLGR